MNGSILRSSPSGFLPGGIHDARAQELIIDAAKKTAEIKFDVLKDGKSLGPLGAKYKVVFKKDGTWNSTSELGRVIETVQGKPFTEEQLGKGLDTSDIVDKPCKVVVERKPGAGGKLESVITSVLPADIN